MHHRDESEYGREHSKQGQMQARKEERHRANTAVIAMKERTVGRLT